jgi:hypothetical protein
MQFEVAWFLIMTISRKSVCDGTIAPSMCLIYLVKGISYTQLCAHVMRSSDHESTSKMVDGFCVLDSRYGLLNTITRDAPTEFTEVHRLMQDRDTLPALITQKISIFAGEGHTSGFEVLKMVTNDCASLIETRKHANVYAASHGCFSLAACRAPHCKILYIVISIACYTHLQVSADHSIMKLQAALTLDDVTPIF